MYKRFSGYLSVFCLSLVLVSCVSIPSQTQLIDESDNQISKRAPADCSIEKFQAISQVISEPEHQLNPENISLLNWNIYKGQRDSWAEDFKSIIKNHDLLLLQEAVASPEVTGLLKHQHTYWNLNTAFYLDGYETGVLTASTVKSDFSCGLRTTEPLIRLPKTVLIGLYPIAGSNKKLLVANLHGINFTLGTEAYEQQIRQMTSIAKQHSGPMIVAGDFNTWSDARVVIVNKMVRQLSLQTVTYSAHNRIKVFGHELDHVYYRGLEIAREEVMNLTSSDHNPIKVNFRLLKL